jgi:hypothetical protein
MAERDARVIAVEGRTLALELLGSACSGCQGGCAGRCSVFATGREGALNLTLPAGPVPRIGQHLRLRLDDAALRRAAFRGYGLAWLGLLLGAGAGHLLARLWGQHDNLLVMLGLVSGTFLAIGLSKRAVPEPDTLLVPDASPHFPLE